MNDAVSPVRQFGDVSRLYEALGKAQAEFPPIEKKRVGSIQGESKQSGKEYKFSYLYADLSDIHTAVRPVLAKHGLTTIQVTQIDQRSMWLTTRLAHHSGAWVESDYPIGSLGDAIAHQRLGAAVTYARRNGLAALLGVAGEDIEEPHEQVDDRADWHGKPAPQAAPPRAEPPRRQNGTPAGATTARTDGAAQTAAGGAPATAGPGAAAAAKDAAPGQSASVSLMITQAQKLALRSQGYSDDQIKDMKPEEAHRLVGVGKPSIIDQNDPLILDLKSHSASFDQLRRWHADNREKINAKSEEWRNEFYPKYDAKLEDLKKAAGIQ